MPVEYSWIASNGNKFTNVIEVLEGQTIVEAGYDMNAIGSSLKGNYTWKNQWYEASNGSGSAIVYDNYVPNGNDITIYGKWVSIVIFNLAQTDGNTYNSGWRPQAPIEIIKGQRCNGRDAFPESEDRWNTWWNSYTYSLLGLTGTGNRIMSWNGSFIPTGNINLYPGR